MTEKDSKQLASPKRVRKDTLNLIIAGCAVLISAASFVATYVQSEAALRQVKAETWPILQLDHGNVNEEGDLEVYMYLQNVGVGPANVKNFNIKYRDKVIPNAGALPRLMYDEEISRDEVGQFITDVVSPRTIPDGASQIVFSLPRTTKNLALWATLNDVRWNLKAEACYCSLFDECFETDFVSEPKEVKMCVAEGNSSSSR